MTDFVHLSSLIQRGGVSCSGSELLLITLIVLLVFLKQRILLGRVETCSVLKHQKTRNDRFHEICHSLFTVE